MRDTVSEKYPFSDYYGLTILLSEAYLACK